nr:MAG TPA: hypothetical protein [Caudoviricetes sp.]
MAGPQLDFCFKFLIFQIIGFIRIIICKLIIILIIITHLIFQFFCNLQSFNFLLNIIRNSSFIDIQMSNPSLDILNSLINNISINSIVKFINPPCLFQISKNFARTIKVISVFRIFRSEVCGLN